MENFDFENSQDWQAFSKHIDKSITGEGLKYMQKLWYQKHVDSKFKVDEVNKLTWLDDDWKIWKHLYTAENLFKIGFLAMLFMREYVQTFGYCFNILALFRQVRNNKQYLQFFRNEFFHNLIYLLMLHHFESHQNFLNYSPLVMHAWVGMTEFIHSDLSFVYERMQNINDKTRKYKNVILLQKNQFEINLMFIFIAARFTGMGNWGHIILYAIYLKMKYHWNERSKTAWYYEDNFFKRKLPKFVLPFYNQLKVPFIYVFTQ